MHPKQPTSPLRREFGKRALAASTAALGSKLALAPSIVRAEAWPSKPIRILVGSPSGGPPDIYARRFASHLAELLGTSVVVENKPGASGALAVEAAAAGAPDGYTVLVGTNGNMGLAREMGIPYKVDPQQAFTPVGFVYEGALSFFAHAGHGVKSIADFIAWSARQPKPPNFAISELLTETHLVAALLSKVTSVALNLVPYKGLAYMPDLAGGQVDFAMTGLTDGKAYVEQGKVTCFSIGYPHRSPLLPDIPTVTEQGHKELQLPNYMLFEMRREVPEDIQRKFYAAVREVARVSDHKERLASLGITHRELSFEQLRTYQQQIDIQYLQAAERVGLRAAK